MSAIPEIGAVFSGERRWCVVHGDCLVVASYPWRYKPGIEPPVEVNGD